MPRKYQEMIEQIRALNDMPSEIITDALLNYFSSNQLEEFIEYLEEENIL